MQRLLVALGLAVLLACSGKSIGAQNTPKLIREIPWADSGVWLRADTHVHTTFSDGSSTVEEVVSRAEVNGLDVIAITDHLDRNLKAATPAYFAAIEAARRAHPRMIVLAGAEWNIPPWGGDEHAVVLVPRDAESELGAFKAMFDDLDRNSHEPALADDGLRWLEAHATRADVTPVIVYEHPSRRAEQSLQRAQVLERWLSVNSLVVGFSGAPGHQGKAPFGGYKNEMTIDRWDPVAARVGGAWDSLLQDGHDVWAAYAPSDFHNDAPTDAADLWPGEFSSTWLYSPDRTQAGVLRSLRAGSFFADHGQLVREVRISVSTPGLARAAQAGEVARTAASAAVRVDVRFKPASREANVEEVEVIGITRDGARVVANERPTESAATFSTAAPRGGIVFRARGYYTTSDGARLAFYTNPVRVVTE
jgi:hypothetical protein